MSIVLKSYTLKGDEMSLKGFKVHVPYYGVS